MAEQYFATAFCRGEKEVNELTIKGVLLTNHQNQWNNESAQKTKKTYKSIKLL